MFKKNAQTEPAKIRVCFARETVNFAKRVFHNQKTSFLSISKEKTFERSSRIPEIYILQDRLH